MQHLLIITWLWLRCPDNLQSRAYHQFWYRLYATSCHWQCDDKGQEQVYLLANRVSVLASYHSVVSLMQHCLADRHMAIHKINHGLHMCATENKESMHMLKQACSLIHTQPCAQATMSFTVLTSQTISCSQVPLVSSMHNCAIAAYTETLCASHMSLQGPWYCEVANAERPTS